MKPGIFTTELTVSGANGAMIAALAEAETTSLTDAVVRAAAILGLAAIAVAYSRHRQALKQACAHETEEVKP